MKITVYNFFSNDNEINTIFNANIVNAVTTLYPNDSIEVIDLFSENIRNCVGCFGCWVKTPGICIHKDIMSSNYKRIMSTDRIVLLMPVRLGFLEAKVKAFIDRLIPLYHPYIEIYEGEMMHEYRYEKYPDIDFYFPDDDLDEEDAQIIEDYCFRTAHHFRVKSNRLILSDEIEVRSLYDTSKHALWANDFHNHARHIFVMPLYVHSMPSVVKAFIEELKPHDESDALHLSFIVQYGFSEQFQSAYLVPHFGQLSNKLNAIYGGTVVKGDMEGIRTRPESSTSKLYKAFTSLGEQYIQEHQFNSAFVSKLSQPAKLSKAEILIINLLRLTGITNTLWDKQLRANGVYDRRNDRPWVYLNCSSLTGLQKLVDTVPASYVNFALVEDWMVEWITRDYKRTREMVCTRFYLPEDVKLPHGDSEVVKLLVEDAEEIQNSHAYNAYTDLDYVRSQIQNGYGAGIRVNGKLVAWAITHDDGAIGFMYVKSEYRNKGYAESITAFIAEKLRMYGFAVYVHIEAENIKSMNLARKLGFVEDRIVRWFTLEQ